MWMADELTTGAAGYSCAVTLRQEGYTGRVIIVNKDAFLPVKMIKKIMTYNIIKQFKFLVRSH